MKGLDAQIFFRWYSKWKSVLKFAKSDFGKPGFFSRGVISASSNFEGKKAWVKDKFARCEMRIEKVSAHDFRSDVGMYIVKR